MNHLQAAHAIGSHSASLQIHAEKSPFLTERLKVFMLPTLACVKKEKTVDYVVGLDELGGSDDFSTHTLAARLSLHGLITYDGTEDYGAPNPNQGKTKGMQLQPAICHMCICLCCLVAVNCNSQPDLQLQVQVYNVLYDMVAREQQGQMMKTLTLSESFRMSKSKHMIR